MLALALRSIKARTYTRIKKKGLILLRRRRKEGPNLFCGKNVNAIIILTLLKIAIDTLFLKVTLNINVNNNVNRKLKAYSANTKLVEY